MLIQQDKQMSIDEFQKETGHKYYDPLWDFVHKLKDFVNTNETETLEKDFREVVDLYFSRAGKSA